MCHRDTNTSTKSLYYKGLYELVSYEVKKALLKDTRSQAHRQKMINSDL